MSQYSADLSDSSKSPGQLLADRYKVITMVGKGGTGTLYHALDQLVDREVAIKLLHDHVARSPVSIKRFKQEAKAASLLSHENICKTLSMGVIDGSTPYLVVEWLEGESLAVMLQRERRLPPALVQQIGVQVCAALSAAHAECIIHRDIKPGNIFITRVDGQQLVKVIDFGAAAFSDWSPPGDGKLTQTGTVIGTPGYMSPEQCLGNPVDRRSDVYSLGCTLYEMLTGTLPFAGNTAYEIMMSHVNQDPNQISSRLARLSKPLTRTILKSIERDPEDRYQDAEQLRQDLLTAPVDETAPEHRHRKLPVAVPLVLVSLALLLALSCMIGIDRARTGRDEQLPFPSIESRIEEAGNHIKNEQFVQASKILESLLQGQPANPKDRTELKRTAAILTLKARCLNAQNEPVQALVVANKAVDLAPGSADACWEKGIAQWNVGVDPFSAVEYLQQALRSMEPSQQDKRTEQFAVLVVHHCFPDRVLAELDERLKNNSLDRNTRAVFHAFRCTAYIELQEYSKARAALNQTLALREPTRADFRKLAHIAICTDHLDQAGLRLTQALATDGMNDDVSMRVVTDMVKEYDGPLSPEGVFAKSRVLLEKAQAMRTIDSRESRACSRRVLAMLWLAPDKRWMDVSMAETIKNAISLAGEKPRSPSQLAMQVVCYGRLAELRAVHSSAKRLPGLITKRCYEIAAGIVLGEANRLERLRKIEEAICVLENYSQSVFRRSATTLKLLERAIELRTKHHKGGTFAATNFDRIAICQLWHSQPEGALHSIQKAEKLMNESGTVDLQLSYLLKCEKAKALYLTGKYTVALDVAMRAVTERKSLPASTNLTLSAAELLVLQSLILQEQGHIREADLKMTEATSVVQSALKGADRQAAEIRSSVSRLSRNREQYRQKHAVPAKQAAS